MISEGSCDTDLKAGVMMLEIQLCITGINCIEHILNRKQLFLIIKYFTSLLFYCILITNAVFGSSGDLFKKILQNLSES